MELYICLEAQEWKVLLFQKGWTKYNLSCGPESISLSCKVEPSSAEHKWSVHNHPGPCSGTHFLFSATPISASWTFSTCPIETCSYGNLTWTSECPVCVWKRRLTYLVRSQRINMRISNSSKMGDKNLDGEGMVWGGFGEEEVPVPIPWIYHLESFLKTYVNPASCTWSHHHEETSIQWASSQDNDSWENYKRDNFQNSGTSKGLWTNHTLILLRTMAWHLSMGGNT